MSKNFVKVSLAVKVAHFLHRLASRQWTLALVLVVAASRTLAAEPPHNVLVLYADNRLIPGIAVLDEAFEAALRAQLGLQVDIFNEFLDLDWLPQGNYREQLVRFLREKYAGTRVDALVAVRGPALQFLLAHRDETLSGGSRRSCGRQCEGAGGGQAAAGCDRRSEPIRNGKDARARAAAAPEDPARRGHHGHFRF